MPDETLSAWHVAAFRSKKKRDSFGSEVDAWKADSHLPDIEIKELSDGLGLWFRCPTKHFKSVCNLIQACGGQVIDGISKQEL